MNCHHKRLLYKQNKIKFDEKQINKYKPMVKNLLLKYSTTMKLFL